MKSYLNSQKQTCARRVHFNQQLEKKIKQNKIMLYMNSQYNPVKLSQPYLNHIKTDTWRANTISIIMKIYRG